MKILGIETSCDESAAALLHVSHNTYHLSSNIVLSQIDIHKKYGGIVPEVAARKHVESIIPVIEESIGKQKPDLIAVTYGPGLITSLQVGVQTAKTLAYIWQVPLVGVNHLEAHLWSFILNEERRVKNDVTRHTSHVKQFPAVGLIVSGGHTEMVLVKGIGSPRFPSRLGRSEANDEAGKYKLIGRTRDDAVGEAFDKVSKMLETGYPGGPIISHFAKKGDPASIDFPRPMIDSDDFDFSFSGLKTAVKYHLKQMPKTGNLSQAFINNVCASFQKAVIDVLVSKTIKATEKYKAKSIILGGGVSANENLIHNLLSITKKREIDFYYPELKFTGDNAAMVALVGFLNKKSAKKNNWQKLVAEANLKLV